MQRREFIKSTGSLLGAYSLVQITDFCASKGVLMIDREIVKTKVGKFNCTVYRDLMFKYLAKDFFINAPRAELDRSLTEYNLSPDNIPSPFIAVLIEFDDRKVLIDTGVGFSEKPVDVRGNSVVLKGRLQQLLEQESIGRDEITDVIITHFHPDHIGGVYNDNGQLNFPKARFHMHDDEWNYWHTSQSDNQPAQFKFFIERNISRLKGENLQLIKGDMAELLPGIRAIKAEGHTPGQIAIHVKDDDKHLLYISDAFLHPLHIEKVQWQTNYDLDHEKARQSRIKLLELAQRENMLINAFHFDFPGLGRVDKFRDQWVWNPSEK